jgi:O-succinylbenzoate synthase
MALSSATKIEYHCYTLRSRDETALNARSQRIEFEGALIRIDGCGVGCIHPWPELGDATLDEELAALAKGNPLNLGCCAVACAEHDGGHRAAGKWMFENLQIPRSHWTAGPNDEAVLVAKLGLATVKLKVGADLDAAWTLVNRWSEQEKIATLRLDFNATLRADTFEEFWQGLSSVTRSKVEFVEDPFPYDRKAWQEIEVRSAVTLALDRDASGHGLEWSGPLVIKPATMSMDTITGLARTRRERLVFTAYMDHAIGQCWAAYVAAASGLGTNSIAGLLTHERFEQDEFFAQLQHDEGVLRPPRGTGLGFDKQLEALPWKPLN